MRELTLENLKRMFAQAAADIAKNEVHLCELDAVCGDGDHGVAIRSAMNAANEAVQNASDLKSAFFDAGFAAMSNSNGSTSTLLGSFFMGISETIKEPCDALNVSAVADAFDGGLSAIKANTKANIGDKTLMDALVPAVKAMCEKTSIKEAFNSAAIAAKVGAQNTINLQAKFGRARNLGEKSIGSADAGASSQSIIFAAFANAL